MHNTLGFLSGFGEFSAPAIADLSNTDHGAMQQVIKQYIMDNPEVIRDALMATRCSGETSFHYRRAGKVRRDDGDPVMGNINGNVGYL